MIARDEVFENLRGRLFGIAYRMLGTRADAEDAVQEAYLRWHQADPESIQNAEAWLVTVTTRLAIDRLRALKTERESYPGPWLPEPLVGRVEMPDRNAEIASDLSIAFLVLLERLAPDERAAFLLRDVFEVEYREIAEVLGKSEPASRQVVHRARERVRGEQRRFTANETARTQLLQQFSAAVEARDRGALLELFAPDAVWTADGGGHGAGTRPIVGADRIARLVLGLANKFLPDRASFDLVTVNGEAGLAFRRGSELIALMAVETDGQRLQRVYAVVNPEKLGGAVTGSGTEPSLGHETTQ